MNKIKSGNDSLFSVIIGAIVLVLFFIGVVWIIGDLAHRLSISVWIIYEIIFLLEFVGLVLSKIIDGGKNGTN
jgi:hypothetical protein